MFQSLLDVSTVISFLDQGVEWVKQFNISDFLVKMFNTMSRYDWEVSENWNIMIRLVVMDFCVIPDI